MAKILKQLSAMPGRLFPAEPPEKQRPPELFIDADALDVYALRRCQSDLSPLYLTRLSLSTDDLHSATLPPPRGLIDTLHEFRVRGRGVMRRVRGGTDRERTGNAVSRSDSFKFQSPGERGDNNIVPPRRRGRKKGAGPPSMPQLLEDYAAPVDLVNRAKFRQVSRSDAAKVVQVDDDYSDVVDSKDYVTPGEDGTRKIYCTNAADSALNEEEQPEEADLPYCQPYGRSNSVTVSPPTCDDGSLYDEVSPQGTSVAVRRPDPLYSGPEPPLSSADRPPSRRSPPRGLTDPPPPPPPPVAHHEEESRETDGEETEEAPVYENVRLWPAPLGNPDRYRIVCRGGELLVGRKRRHRPAQERRAKPPITRSCEDLRGRAADDDAIYVNAGDPIVQLERRPGGEPRRDDTEMSRRLYETAFDSTARPPAPDPDELARLAAAPRRDTSRVEQRPPRSRVGRSSNSGTPTDAWPESPAAPRGDVGSREEVVRAAEVRAEVHAAPPADSPPARPGRAARTEFAGLWGSPDHCASESRPRPAPVRPERGVLRSAGRPRSLCTDQAGTLGHRYECLEVGGGGSNERQPPRLLFGGDSGTRHSGSGSSTLSSLESLRSSSGDSDSTGRGDSLSRSHLSADLYRRLATAKVPVLSPISDKSQELDSPAAPGTGTGSGSGSPQPRPSAWEQPSRPRLRCGLHGSDSGISVDSHGGEAASQLPFDMPKLRRRAAASLCSPQNTQSAPPAPPSLGTLNVPEPAAARPSLSLSLDRGESASSATDSAPRRPVMALSLGCASNTAGEQIDLSVPFQQQRWYHGAITRVEAEKTLRSEREGSYLVRICESSRHDYSLSLKSARGFMHMKIRQDPGSGKFILGQFSKPFESIPQMIQHYSLTKLPIRGAEHMSLLHPVADDQLL